MIYLERKATIKMEGLNSIFELIDIANTQLSNLRDTMDDISKSCMELGIELDLPSNKFNNQTN